MRRSCSAPILKEACRRYQVVTIPIAHLKRGPIPNRPRGYAAKGRLDNLSVKRYSVLIPGFVAPAFRLQLVRRAIHVRDLRLHAGLPLLEHGLALRIGGQTLCTPSHIGRQSHLRYRTQLSLDMRAHVIDELPGGDRHGFPTSPLAIQMASSKITRYENQSNQPSHHVK